MKLESPDFDLDENLGEDYFTWEKSKQKVALTDSQEPRRLMTVLVPTESTRLKNFGSEGYFEGKVVEGPFIWNIG